MNAVREEVSASESRDRIGAVGLCRALVRFVLIMLWTLGCWAVVRCICFVGLFFKGAVKAKKAVGYCWVCGIGRLLGTRVKVIGKLPKAPYFIVGNHLCWIDFFVGLRMLEGRPVVEDPVRTLPLVGPLASCLDPIYVRRVKEDTPRVLGLMVEALKRGEGVVLAPENPKTTIPLGSGIRMFRAGLIEAAIQADKPVHYVCLNYRTPDGWPSPKKALMFGPNPLYTDANGKIPDSEIAAHGGQHSYFRHVVGVLALPWHEISMTFGDEPIMAPDRISLANALHRAVSKHFIPLT